MGTQRRRLRSIVLAALLAVVATALATSPSGAQETGVISISLDPEAPERGMDFVLHQRADDTWHERRPTHDQFTWDPAERRMRIQGVAPGTYRLELRQEDDDRATLASTFLPRAGTVEGADDVIVRAGSTTVLDEIVPLAGGRLTGTVRREDPASGIPPGRVEVLRWTSTAQWSDWSVERTGELGPDGRYVVEGVGSGPRILRVVGPTITGSGWGRQGRDALTYSGGAVSTTEAERVEVAPGATEEVPPIDVVPNGTLGGSVTDTDGTPLAGVEVLIDELPSVGQPFLTDDAGRWDSGPLEQGSYEVRVDDPLHRVVHTRRTAAVEVRQPTVVTAVPAHAAPYWLRAPSLGAPENVVHSAPLTVDPGDLAQADAVVTRVEWFIGREEPIATGPTFTPPPDLVGDLVQARVTAVRRGLTSAAHTEQTMVRLPSYFEGRPTTTTGSPVVGQEVVADPSPVTPDPVEDSTWQWYRGTTAIPGADEPTYTAGAADVGKNLSARVRADRPGYATRTLSTNATGKVGTTRATVSAAPVAQGSRRVRLSVSAWRTPVPKTSMDGYLDVYRTRSGDDRITTLKMADGRAVVDLASQPKGAQTYWVRFRPWRSGFVPSTSAKRRVTVR